MTITLRQKDLENDNKSLYLDIYDNGKRKFEFLSLYLIPEINQETKERNEATLKRAQEIRAERILHPETIPEKGHLMVVPDIPDDDSPEVIDWIQTYMEWMDGNPEYSKRTVEQTQYLQERMKEFLKAKRRPHITLMKFDKTWFKAFFLWLKNDYVPQKYVRVTAKPLSNASLRNMQQRIVAVFNKAVKTGKLKANPFYQLEKEDTISKPKSGHKLYLTPDELKLFMASEETNGVRETQLAFGFACLTGLRISDIRALRWSNIMRNEATNTLVIVQKKTKELNAVPICSTAEAWMPPKKDDKVFHLPAHANVDAALKRIAKKVGITKTISFHTSYHTFLCGLQRYNLVFGRKYAVGADGFYLQHAAVVLYLVEALLPLVHQWEGGANLHSICVRLLVQRGERDLFLCFCWQRVAGIQEHAGQEG